MFDNPLACGLLNKQVQETEPYSSLEISITVFTLKTGTP